MQKISVNLLAISGVLLISRAIFASHFFEENNSINFINRWGFQSLCDHIFDPRTVSFAHPTSTEPGGVTFEPKNVRQGDLIFARDIELFFETMHPHIAEPYILITHGEFRDTCMEYHLSYLDDEKLLRGLVFIPPMQDIKNFIRFL